MTVAAVARLFADVGISGCAGHSEAVAKATVYKLAARGKLPRVTMGRRVLFLASDVERYVAEVTQ